MTSRIIPASIRNNNPGAMYPGRASRKFGATTEERLDSRDGVHRIARFPTAIHGGAALFELLARGYVNRTLEQAIRKWSGGFHVASYLAVMRERADMQPTEYITPEKARDPAWAIRFARAMAWHEAGREFPMDADDWAEAHAMFLADGKAPEPAADNDVPTKRHEQRIEETVKTAVSAGAGAAGVGAAAAEVAGVLPGPPAGWSATITNVDTYMQLGNTVAGWLSNPILLVCVGLAIAASLFIPARR